MNELKITANKSPEFETAMKFVREAEGGLYNHPNDPAGLTNMGITQRDYPLIDIKNLTREGADEIYWQDYWLKSAAPQVPFPAYISYFDSCVNTGRTQANKFLQRVVGATADGIVGPYTRSLLSKKDPKDVAFGIIDQRQDFYNNLCEKRPKLAVFRKGWTNRNNNLRKYIQNLLKNA
jgi:lysozyme family protein